MTNAIMSFASKTIYSLFISVMMIGVSDGLAAERKPWEVLRFVQQSSKFVTIPFLGGPTSKRNIKAKDIMWKVSDGNKNTFTMAPLDDVVMGGASSSSFDSNTGIWSGVVTDANNGGFIGIRSTPAFDWNMEQCKGLEWTIKSYETTTKRFKFVVRDSTEFNGITWTTSVDVKPGMNTIRILFDKQISALFARTVPDQIFRKDNVVSVQIAYSKFEYDGKLNPKFSLGDIKIQLLELRAI